MDGAKKPPTRSFGLLLLLLPARREGVLYVHAGTSQRVGRGVRSKPGAASIDRDRPPRRMDRSINQPPKGGWAGAPSSTNPITSRQQSNCIVGVLTDQNSFRIACYVT